MYYYIPLNAYMGEVCINSNYISKTLQSETEKYVQWLHYQCIALPGRGTMFSMGKIPSMKKNLKSETSSSQNVCLKDSWK